VKRLEEKIDRNEQELLDSKRQAQKYMDRVLNTNDEVKGKFEVQYQKEIQELKERHTKEIQLSKENLIEVYEKKNEYLKERKDEAERRILKLEQDLKDKSKSYEEILFEFRSLQRQGDEELGHLKLQSKSKSDELMRVTHLYEDNMMLVKELKLENETYKQKIDVLKSEYYKLESMER
jgi:progesterone-induced-blocking factor 1